jgi:hypothetical protein
MTILSKLETQNDNLEQAGILKRKKRQAANEVLAARLG